MAAAEKRQLMSLLDELSKAVEELLRSGLTAASKSTVERLDVTFKEASRMKLLRLGSTLRIANEEIVRFTSGSPQFSARRLTFFLGRAWLLAAAMRKALDSDDQPALDRLQFTPETVPIERLHVVVLGVAKRVVPGAFASFDFRLRAIGAAGPVAPKEPLVWSCVFPLRRDLDLPCEAFLHLPQKQGFKPSLLLERKTVEVTRCAVSQQPGSATRLILGEGSKMTAGAPFTDWSSLLKWDLDPAAARLEQHTPTPLDLEIELQEELFLPEWAPGELRSTDDGYELLAVVSRHLPLEVRLDTGPSGVPARGVITEMAKRKRRPPLYGVVHYESCRILLQPLAALSQDGIEYLTVSPDKISQAELVKAMKFT